MDVIMNIRNVRILAIVEVMMKTSCCIVGHRDVEKDYLLKEVMPTLENSLANVVKEGYNTFYVAFSSAVNILTAGKIIELREENPELCLFAVFPYPNKIKDLTKAESETLHKANSVLFSGEKYNRRSYINVNRYIIEKTRKLIALYDGRNRGSTFEAIRYASLLRKDIELIRI